MSLVARTDKTSYAEDDLVTISGMGVPNDDLTVSVSNPAGNLVAVSQTKTDSSGRFQCVVMRFPRGGSKTFPFGNYILKVMSAGAGASVSISATFASPTPSEPSSQGLKVCFFPHSEDEFNDEYELRNWLDQDLRKYQAGYYYLKKASGLGTIQPGSVVFFHRSGWVVGCAVVEEGKRPTTTKERTLNPEFEYVVKFIPESIWALRDHQFLSTDEVANIIGTKPTRGFPVITELLQLLKIFEEVAKASIYNTAS